jgi:poly(glycerol-phosphate) alpha-glucosyltransferase
MLDAWALRNSHWKKRIAATLYERKHLEDASCIRALCQAEAESIRACGLRNPICVIPNGIGLPEARSVEHGLPNAVWQAFVPPGSRVLLYLGRIHPKKGLVNLLKAWKEVRGSKSQAGSLNPADWVLAIAGWDEGGHESELKRLATELGLQWETSRPRDDKTAGPQDCGTHTRGRRTEDSRRCSVLFLGPRFGEAKEALYRDCDAFILPSFSEGLPMVVLEAWAFAKPVLMTPECNLPQGFAAGAALRITKNVEGIVNGLRGLFRFSGAALQSTGARGRDLVATRFSWGEIGETMRAVCAWVSESGPKPDCVQTYS